VPSSRIWSAWRPGASRPGWRTNRAGVRYWPVPPLGVFYRVSGDELRVVQVVDARRLLETAASLEANLCLAQPTYVRVPNLAPIAGR
jgi:hypothetical protein